jgi:hypothetical protein
VRWLERVLGLLTGLLAIAAGRLSFQWQAGRIIRPSTCNFTWLLRNVTCDAGMTLYGPDSNASLHNVILLPVAMVVVAALAIALCAQVDAGRPTHSGAVIALSLVATLLLIIGVGVLYASRVVVTSWTVTPQSFHSTGIMPEFNVGALFVPTLAATLACVITICRPRLRAQATAASPL